MATCTWCGADHSKDGRICEESRVSIEKSNSEQFEFWLQETHNMKSSEFVKLDLDHRVELISEFSDDAVMEMREL